jgi:hypothetical protein
MIEGIKITPHAREPKHGFLIQSPDFGGEFCIVFNYEDPERQSLVENAIAKLYKAPEGMPPNHLPFWVLLERMADILERVNYELDQC